VISQVAAVVCDVDPGHPTRVAIDGATASGKSTFARELTAAVSALGRPAIHLTMDGFHHHREHRYRRGRLSADGYYDDAYDFAALAELVLIPLGPGGNRRYRTRVIDLASDAEIGEAPVEAPADAVVSLTAASSNGRNLPASGTTASSSTRILRSPAIAGRRATPGSSVGWPRPSTCTTCAITPRAAGIWLRSTPPRGQR
jgi:hypothetical protein